MLKISIIVPVYNVEKLLERCIDSIISQTYTYWELLLIDDGSKDSSGIICDQYAAKDQRILVYHLKNGGVSRARNFGIRQASCQWITFVDSDDYIQQDFLQSFIDCNPTKGSLYSCGIKYTYPRHAPVVMFNYPAVSFRIDDVQSMRTYGILANGCPVGKLYNVEILKVHNIKFDEELSLNEDHIFVMNYLRYMDNVQLLNKILYNYWFDQFVTSLTKKRHKTHESLRAAEAIFSSLADLCKKNKCQPHDILRTCDISIFGASQIDRAIRACIYEDNPLLHIEMCAETLKKLHIDKEISYNYFELLYKDRLIACLLYIYILNFYAIIRNGLVRVAKNILNIY